MGRLFHVYSDYVIIRAEIQYMKTKFHQLRTSQGLQQGLVQTFVGLSSTGLAAVAIIVLSRFVSPQEFGLFSVGLAIMTIVSRFSDLGLTTALQKSLGNSLVSEPDKVSSLWQQSLKLKTISTSTTLLLCLLASPFIAAWLKIPQISFVVLTAFFSVSTVSYEHIQIALVTSMRFFNSSVMSLLQACIKIVGIALLSVLNLTQPIWSVFVFFLALAISSFFGIITIPKNFWAKAEHEIFARNLLISISKFTSVAIIAGAISENVDTLFVQIFMTSFDTGIFSTASKIAIFFAIAGSSLSGVFNVRAARYSKKEDLFAFLKKTLLLTSLVAFVILALIPFSQTILRLASPQYVSGAFALQIFLVATAISIITTPFYAVFFALHRPNFFAISGIFQAASLIIFDWLFIPMLGVEGAAVARVLNRLLLLIFTAYYAYSTIRMIHGKVAFRS